ncbi:MAG: M14 family metallopeptidase [Flavobacteriaceae bacterium]|nr:M14 family metallopeptidase [Flavobacteriaceae bacterium]
MKKIIFYFFILCFFSVQSQNLVSPDSFLGYELGSKFSRLPQVESYFKYLANSPKVTMEYYGETYENRPLYTVFISSDNNIKNLESIKKNHLQSAGLDKNSTASTDIPIVWLSFNVHGNEASGTETAMQVAYDLLTKNTDWLNNTVVIIDPCSNPDGRERYVNWFYEVRNEQINTNIESLEHNERWPGGRPNHYFFDLNRDWVWATQTETKNRIKLYQQWMPHVHADVHEQGINEPYYFAPAAEPFHEIITPWQREFQQKYGKNTANYFDKNGWLYFTKERFDLFYPSYGDTYPTFMGAIGMTLEKAGNSRGGLAVLNQEGHLLTLKERIEHQKTASLSAVETAYLNRKKLVEEFQQFFKNNTNHTYKSYVINSKNTDQLQTLTNLLDLHKIEYQLTKSSKVKGFDYVSGTIGTFSIAENSLVIQANQPKGKMVKVLFEPQSKLENIKTYDITAWSLPYAHGLEAIASYSEVADKPFEKFVEVKNTLTQNSYAYISKWNHLNDARFLASLIKNDIKVRFSETPFNIQNQTFESGSLIITRTDNQHISNLSTILETLANQHQRSLTEVNSGMVNSGSDFGASTVKLIQPAKIAVLTGSGVSPYAFGEVWHLFEQQIQYPINIIGSDYFDKIQLANYTVLILPSGNYQKIISDLKLTEIQTWIKNGGKLIVMGSALNRFADHADFAIKNFKKEEEKDKPTLTPYKEVENEQMKKEITGAVFKTIVDNSHPMAFGLGTHYFTLKLGSQAFPYLKRGFNVSYLGNNPQPFAGYAGKDALKNIGDSFVFAEESMGDGSVIYMVDNSLFRGFWEGGRLFFVNAVFLTNNHY